MKKLFAVIIGMLAINFLALAGGVGYLRSTGKLDREKLMAIKEILFPAPATQPVDVATTQPADTTPQPMLKLDELLAQQVGRPASEQVEFIQHSFDTRMAQLDLRQRELNDLQRQIDLSRDQLSRDRGTLDKQRKEVETKQTEDARLASDKGFQDSLALYKSMTGKQVKTVFMAKDESSVAQYLQAMEPRTASRIIKEFKSPQETQFIEKVLDRIRQSSPATQPAAAQASTKE